MQTIRIYSQDIGMEFGIEKCAMIVMKKGIRETVEGIELRNRKSIRILEGKENYKYLGILESSFKQRLRKKKQEKSTLEERESFWKSRSTEVMNTWEVPLVRYSGPFLK